MSYDVMVFEAEEALRDRRSFNIWYEQQTEQFETLGDAGPGICTPNLQAWYAEMIEQFPNMNSPEIDDIDEEDEQDSFYTEYTFGPQVIYTAFAFSVAERACNTVFSLTEKYQLGMFDVMAADDGEVIFP